MKKKHITLKRMAALALVLLSSAFTTQVRAEEQEIAVVVKIGGIPWFTAMEKGIKEAGKEQNVKAYMVGPTTADPAQQVRAVEDLIAKKVSAIGVVPNDAKALEPVFERAKAAGIPVITHESPDQVGNVWDIELIDNKEYGEQHMGLRQIHGRGRRIHCLCRRIDGAPAQHLG
jgi:simple sugar transport system substrate-binding protein